MELAHEIAEPILFWRFRVELTTDKAYDFHFRDEEECKNLYKSFSDSAMSSNRDPGLISVESKKGCFMFNTREIVSISFETKSINVDTVK